MAGRIPSAFIDELLARTDIVDLVGSRVQLRKAGKDFQARCPFHDEKTPSFTVSPDKQFYHCFGCGAHGTAIGFLMEHDRLAFPEAVEELARRAGLPIPVDAQALRPGPGPDHAPLYALLERVADLYRRQLREHPERHRAVDYLKCRGLTGAVAARYGLGYAPPGWDFLLTHLGAERTGRLIEAGLVADQDGRRYDRLRDRITFPIRDRRGRVIGFGGRLLGDGKPKYLNSPETPVFHKGRELYGLYEAQRARRKSERLLVVEGYMDVIALAQFGIDYAVATLGTATTVDHLRVLLRSAPELVFCFDGDRAGRDAAWKALEAALPLATGHQSLRFLFLPEGEDPDTLVRHEGPGAFEQRLASAQPLSDFFFQHLSDQVDMVSRDGRARLVTLAKPLIERAPAGIYRDMLEHRLAALAGVAPRARAPAGRHRSRKEVGRPARPSRMAQAIALLLDHPELAAEVEGVDDDWRRLDSPGVAILSQLLETIAAYPGINKAALIERWRDHEHFAYLQRLSVEAFLRDVPEGGAGDELTGALASLSKAVRDAERLRPLNRRSTAEWSPEVREELDRAFDPARTRRR